MVYDMNVERVNRALSIGRKYLTWVQNSVFEGELTKAQFEHLKAELKQITDEEEDSIVFYLLRRKEYVGRETLGQCPEGESLIL
jgi:CRISPR-associated protein Cas2